jgi:hypothetical protein
MALTYDSAPILPADAPPSKSNNDDKLVAWENQMHLKDHGRSISITGTTDSTDIRSRIMSRSLSIDEFSGESKVKSNPTLQLSEYKCYAETFFYVDYFNNMLKCWEPLIEPLSAIVMHEQVSSE